MILLDPDKLRFVPPVPRGENGFADIWNTTIGSCGPEPSPRTEGGLVREQMKRYDKVSANTASCEPQCYEKSDWSQDARSRSPDMPYKLLEH